MRKTVIAPENIRLTVAARVASRGVGKGSTELGITSETARRIIAGKTIGPETLAKLARKSAPDGPTRVRTAQDFKDALAVEAPRREQPIVAWDLERIRAARDAQMRGDFRLAVRLAEAIRTDDALFTAYVNRIAPQSAVAMQMVPYPGVRGAAVLRKAQDSIFVSKTTLSGINGTLANHGVAIGYNHHETNADGTRVIFRHVEWPLEWVRWNHSREVLETSTRGGVRIPIVHGDSRFTIYRKANILPWTQEAALLPAAFIWAAHANGIRDWAAGSKSHGEAKVIGTLPSGVTTEAFDENGMPKLTDQAFTFLQMLRQIMSGDNPVGVMPFGSDAKVLTNTATMFQVFSELILSREKAAMRVYQGTDAALGAAGGAPGVDISLLFGVASTKVQGDLTAIEQGLNTGVYQPWTAINEGDSRYAPCAEYQLPDPDADKKSEENSAKRIRLFDTLDRMRTLNLEITQATIDNICAEYGIANPPQLGSNAAVQLQLQATDIAAITRGREGRASQGLPPFGDERDDLTIPEIEIQAKGAADLAVAIAKAQAAAEAKNLPPDPLAPAPTPAGNTAAGAPPASPPGGNTRAARRVKK